MADGRRGRARVGDNDTAFHGRTAGHTFNINGNSETADGFDEQRHWARDYWDALSPHHTSVYVNFLMEEGEDRVRQAYGNEKYARLKTLKRTYDPDEFLPPQPEHHARLSADDAQRGMYSAPVRSNRLS